MQHEKRRYIRLQHHAASLLFSELVIDRFYVLSCKPNEREAGRWWWWWRWWWASLFLEVALQNLILNKTAAGWGWGIWAKGRSRNWWCSEHYYGCWTNLSIFRRLVETQFILCQLTLAYVLCSLSWIMSCWENRDRVLCLAYYCDHVR